MKELKRFILRRYVDENFNIVIDGLDFSDFDGDIIINNVKVKNNLFQSNYKIGGSLIQGHHKVGEEIINSNNQTKLNKVK